MLILGLLLVVVSVAVAAVLIAYNGGGVTETVSAFGWDIAEVNLIQAFIAGMVVALVFLLGVWMIMRAGRRGRENRARYKEARREAKTAAAERDELAERVRRDEEQLGHQPTVTQPMESPPQQSVHRADMDTGPRHAAPPDQPVITNIRPGQSPSR